MGQDACARYPSLEGLPVLVTGGASGIGEAMVKAFAAQGSKVGFLDIARDAGETLAAHLTALGQIAHFAPCDLRDIAALRAGVAMLERQNGPALVLLNNAANDQRHGWQDMTPDYWDERMAVNLRHLFFAIQAVAPGMMAARRGSIINFGSVSWKLKMAEMPAYTTAKAAVHGLTRSFAKALGKHNIRVNTIVPGWVMTERQLNCWVTPEAEQELDAAQVLNGRIQPEDLARAALFLAADDSAMISAQELTVDAGWT